MKEYKSVEPNSSYASTTEILRNEIFELLSELGWWKCTALEHWPNKWWKYENVYIAPWISSNKKEEKYGK